ncbi:MAG: hypothetical protein V1754_07910 [Pseudomonadota bacterium]
MSVIYPSEEAGNGDCEKESDEKNHEEKSNQEKSSQKEKEKGCEKGPKEKKKGRQEK